MLQPSETTVIAYCVAKPRECWAAHQEHGGPVTIDERIVKLVGMEGVTDGQS